jgi:hypothetical protein
MTLPSESNGFNFTPEELESASLGQIRLLNNLADDLGQQISGYAPYDELVRHEITRACSTAFEITRALNNGDPRLAYRIASGEPDEDGTVLGVAI